MRNNQANVLAITSDIDWSEDEIITYMLGILKEYDIQATFFCTHDVSHIQGIARHELAIHPNFTGEKTEPEVIQKLVMKIPQARGIRNHRLYLHSGLFGIYRDLGLEYDSNYFMPNQAVSPFFISPNILELPMFFEDDSYFLTSSDFTLNSLNLESNGLKIFNFHPIHIFLNTRHLSDYETAKDCFHHPHKLLQYRNKGRGTHNLFIDLLKYIRDRGLRTYTMNEINSLWRERGHFTGSAWVLG